MKAGSRLDYSRSFEKDLNNFNPGYRINQGPLEDDLVLVQFHADTALGDGRSAKWWTTLDQANSFSTIEDVQQLIQLLVMRRNNSALIETKFLKVVGLNISLKTLIHLGLCRRGGCQSDK